MSSPLSTGSGSETFGSLGKIIASVFGVQGTFLEPFLVVLGLAVTSSASGIRLYLRKKQGKAVFGFAWFYLILHFVLIFLLFVKGESPVANSNLPEPDILERIYHDKPILIYFAGIVVLLGFYLFRDFLPVREGVERSPDYTGKGILSFLAKGEYQKELYTNLADPLLGGIIGYWFFQTGSTKNLGWVVLIGSGCLLIESLAYLAQDWRRRIGAEISETMGDEYSGKNRRSKQSKIEDGKEPKITKNR